MIDKQLSVSIFCLLALKLSWSLKIDCNYARWGPWRCTGDEDLCQGSAHRYKCVGGDCTKWSPCSNLLGHKQTAECKVVRNHCVPWWAEWTSWSACSATCGYTERRRYRPCTGVGVGTVALTRSCRDPDYVRTLPQGRGFSQSNACFLRRLCPRVHGGWSSWGRFSQCSTTCGTGLRRRQRLCSNPRPSGGGMTCTGIDSDAAECATGRRCPVHGRWCKWLPVVECSKQCNSGTGWRLRRCECPAPDFGGMGCVGAMEKLDVCNSRPCPYKADLTDSESQLLHADQLSQRQADQWRYSNGGQLPQLQDVIVLQCPRSRPSRRRVFELEDRFPKKSSLWIFGDMKINDSSSYFTDDEFLIIRGLSLDNIGFYAFAYIRDPGKDIDIVCLFSVYVTDLTLILQAGQNLNLSCLASHYDSLTRLPALGEWRTWWTFEPADRNRAKEDNLWENSASQIRLTFMERRIIEDVDERAEGIFTCRLENLPPKTAGRIFVTQQFTVKLEATSKFWQRVKRLIIRVWLPILTISSFGAVATLVMITRFRQQAQWFIRTGGALKTKATKT